MVDHVESFRQVNCHGGGAVWLRFVEALCNLRDEWQQGGGSGPGRPEAMLDGGEGEGV